MRSGPGGVTSRGRLTKIYRRSYFFFFEAFLAFFADFLAFLAAMGRISLCSPIGTVQVTYETVPSCISNGHSYDSTAVLRALLDRFG